MSQAILPPKATVDALHIAMVAHHRIQYLLTWNCTHIANAKLLPRIHQVLTELGCPIPIIGKPGNPLTRDVVVRLVVDPNLKYEHVIKAVSACIGRRDEKTGTLIRYINTIKLSTAKE